MMAFRRYSIIATATAIGIVLAVILANAAVDPIALWSPVTGSRLERVEALSTGGRVHKAERLDAGNWQAIILGTSRCLRGIDPANAAFETMRTYNACLPGADMDEIAKIGRFALGHNPNLKRVVIGLDFVSFSTIRSSGSDFEQSAFAGRDPVTIVLDYLGSADTLGLSFNTVLNAWRGGKKAILQANGFADWNVDPPKQRMRRRFVQILSHQLQDPENYGVYRYSSARVKTLESLLADFHARGVEVWLYVSPLHAWQMEAIHDLGLDAVYTEWLRDMARAAKADRIYDFSGYNAITTEAVPKAGDTAEMRWYWECSHFRKEMGDMILARLSGHGQVPNDFGVALTEIGAGRGLEEARQRYESSHAAEADIVARLVKDTSAERARLRQIFP